MDECDWESVFENFMPGQLMEALGMNERELNAFAIATLYQAFSSLGRGKALALVDFKKGIERIVNLPVVGEIKWNPDVRTKVDEFLLLITDRKDHYFTKIARIEYHDWMDSGNISVSFATGRRDIYDESGIYKKFFRKPLHLNQSGNPTYERFGQTFRELGGDVIQLASDYKFLFGEELPPLKR